MTDNAWSNPFDPGDRQAFIAYARGEEDGGLGPDCSIEPTTLRFAFLLGPDDIGSDSSPLEIDVLAMAADAATSATAVDDQNTGTGRPGWLTTRTQDPLLGQSKVVPRSMLIMAGGLGVVVQASQIVVPAFQATPASSKWTPAAAAADALGGLQAAFDAMTVEVTNGRVRYFECTGHEATSFGSSEVGVFGPPRIVTTDTGVSTMSDVLYAGRVSEKMRGWWQAPVPLIIGADEQLEIGLTIPRATPWPIVAGTRFRVDVLMPCIIARLTKGKNKGGADCPPGGGGMRRQIPGKTRW